LIVALLLITVGALVVCIVGVKLPLLRWALNVDGVGDDWLLPVTPVDHC
jgi:hypothetical protein